MLYFKFLSIHLKSAMQYKTSFFLSAFGQFLTSFTAFLSIYFLFSRFNTVEGYTLSEVLVCYGVILISFSTAECFFRGFDTFTGIISNGEFDRMMVRPISPMYHVLCSRIEFSRIGRYVQAIAVFVIALILADIDWCISRIITLVLMFLGGTVLFAGLFIIYASICFFTTEGLEFMNIFTDGGREFGSYPLDVYGSRGLLRFFTFVIPLACVQYYPFTYVIGHSDNMLYMLCPLAAFLFLIPCVFLWKIGVRHYKSTGS